MRRSGDLTPVMDCVAVTIQGNDGVSFSTKVGVVRFRMRSGGVFRQFIWGSCGRRAALALHAMRREQLPAGGAQQGSRPTRVSRLSDSSRTERTRPPTRAASRRRKRAVSIHPGQAPAALSYARRAGGAASGAAVSIAAGSARRGIAGRSAASTAFRTAPSCIHSSSDIEMISTPSRRRRTTLWSAQSILVV